MPVLFTVSTHIQIVELCFRRRPDSKTWSIMNIVERQNDLSQIIELFSRLESLLRINNANGLTDANHLSEDFFCLLLNKIFDLELVNLNASQVKNFPAVDLGDYAHRISFQVTTEDKKKKIEDSIRKFNEHNLSEKFSSMRFLIIGSKKRIPRSPLKILPAGCSFDYSKDVYCLSDLVSLIRPLGVQEIKEILSLLDEEINGRRGSRSEEVLANEVQTIGDLIVFLSTNKDSASEKWKEEPDPDNKINHRFADHAPFLRSQIVTLLPKYARAREEVSTSLNLDTMQVSFIRDYLRMKSDMFLSKTNGDPKLALDNLTDFFSTTLAKSGKKYDEMAIRFFLIDELTKCNVFPNQAEL